MTIDQVIKQVEDLRDRAAMRADRICDEGRMAPLEDRARSEGYASAYSFCLIHLKDIRDGRITV